MWVHAPGGRQGHCRRRGRAVTEHISQGHASLCLSGHVSISQRAHPAQAIPQRPLPPVCAEAAQGIPSLPRCGDDSICSRGTATWCALASCLGHLRIGTGPDLMRSTPICATMTMMSESLAKTQERRTCYPHCSPSASCTVQGRRMQCKTQVPRCLGQPQGPQQRSLTSQSGQRRCPVEQPVQCPGEVLCPDLDAMPRYDSACTTITGCLCSEC